MNKGWFAVPGVQQGDRSVVEQLRGLQPLLAGIAGKRVLDLGCAEGYIAKACIEAGAVSVLGLDNNPGFVRHAQQLGLDPARAMFVEQDLNVLRGGYEADVVLALAILHKLTEPTQTLRQVAGWARERLVIRLPVGSEGFFETKHRKSVVCDTKKELPVLGFALERDETGPRGERVHYWKRIACDR